MFVEYNKNPFGNYTDDCVIRAIAAVEQYLAPTPRPAYIVQNPNCCAPNFGCGCAAA